MPRNISTSHCVISNDALSSKYIRYLRNHGNATTAIMMMMIQVGPGDDFMLTLGGFNDALSTLGDSMTNSYNVACNLNGKKFSTK